MGPSGVGVPVDKVSSSPLASDADAQQRLQMIAVIMDNLMGLVNPNGEVYTGLSRAADITHGRPI